MVRFARTRRCVRGMRGLLARSGLLGRRAALVLAMAWTAGPLTVVLMTVLTVASGVTPAITAWVSRALLNDVVGGKAGTRVLGATGAGGGHVARLAVLLGLVGLLTAAMPHARRFVESDFRRELGLLVQDRMYLAINGYPGISRFESPVFFDKIRLVQQLGNNNVTKLVSSGMTVGQSLVTAISLFATLEIVNPVLAGLVVSTAVPAIAAQLSNTRERVRLEWRRSPAMRRQMFYGRLLGDRDAAKEVRLFGLGDFLRHRMLTELRSVNRGQRALDRRIFATEGLLAGVAAVITAAGLVWVVRQAASGRLSVGDVSMFTMAVVGVQGAIANLVARLADVYQSLLMLDHYVDIVSAEPDLPLAERPRALKALRRGIEIRDVWFRYDPTQHWVLRGTSLFIPHGTSAGLIGLNGAGKSTLVKLLCRLYDPERGSIHWDGVDIRELDVDDYRKRIGTVFQDYMSYDLTAAENVGMGDLQFLDDPDRIENSARHAGIHEKLMSLPHGYETMLSRAFFSNKEKDDPEAGVLLSGGQWQRLALARGLMRADRDLLILDEPSSGLDAQAEHEVHRRLREIRAGKTSLLISHRLGSVRAADNIFVLTHGRIAEQGTHQELMSAEGEYHKLFTLQASSYADDERAAPAFGQRT